MRPCSVCKQTTNNFYNDHDSYCRTCRKHYQMAYKYDLTPAQWRQLYADQVGLCLICQQPLGPKPAVDHIHDTKIVRGLLCYACNIALGQFRESPRIMLRAIRYIQWHTARSQI